MKVLIWSHRKMDNMVIDATDELVAYLYLFKQMDEWGCYLADDANSEWWPYIQAARAGDGRRASVLITERSRQGYEYEFVDEVQVIRP